MSDQIKKAQEYLDKEIKYFNKLKKIFLSDEFIKRVKDLEKNINDNYDFIKKNNLTANIVDTPLERLLRFYSYKCLSPINTFPYTFGSDVCFETEDAIFNLDAKSTNLVTNSGDRNDLVVGNNQISFDHIRFDKCQTDNINFDGFILQRSLSESYYKKPTLTFFFKMNYSDDNIKFKIIEFSLYTAPNNKVYKYLIDNKNLIQNIKSWGYVSSDKTASILKNNKLKPSKKIKNSWIEFKIKTRQLFFDNKVQNPITNDKYTIRSKQDGKYKVTYSAISARLKKNLLVDFYKEDGFLKKDLSQKKLNL